eukprot:scaffold744_cov111-Isochrysis_galbana.AAC.10
MRRWPEAVLTTAGLGRVLGMVGRGRRGRMVAAGSSLMRAREPLPPICQTTTRRLKEPGLEPEHFVEEMGV